MFHNTEQEDIEMVRSVGEAILTELMHQPEGPLDLDRVAIAAILAMTRWARSHPVKQQGLH